MDSFPRSWRCKRRHDFPFETLPLASSTKHFVPHNPFQTDPTSIHITTTSSPRICNVHLSYISSIPRHLHHTLSQLYHSKAQKQFYIQRTYILSILPPCLLTRVTHGFFFAILLIGFWNWRSLLLLPLDQDIDNSFLSCFNHFLSRDGKEKPGAPSSK